MRAMRLGLLLAMLPTGLLLATDYILTASGAVGSNLSATPAALVPTGTGAAATPYTYSLGTGALDMDAYKITSAGNAYHAAFVVGSLTYDGAEADGGVFDFKGPSYRGNVRIEASGTIALRSIDTSSTSRVSSADRPGSITLQAVEGVIVAQALLAVQTGNEYPGNVVISASAGPVLVGGLIDTGRSRRPGTITVTGATLALHDLWAGAGSTTLTCYGSKVTLTSTEGDLRVDGSINNWCGAEGAGGGDVVLEAAAHLTVTGGVTNRTHRAADAGTKGGGAVSMVAGGNLDVGGGINSTVVHAGALPGDLDLAAGGTIRLATLDVSLHHDITLSAGQATLVTGPLVGLASDLDGDALTVGRFAAVTGHIVYDPLVVENAYLGGKAYTLTASVGGAFQLRPSESGGTLVLLR